MNFSQLCSTNYGNTQEKSFFFNISYSFEVFLKTNANFSPCLFCFVSVFVNIHFVPQHGSGFHQRYEQSYVELKIAHLHHWKTIVSVLYWHCSGKWSFRYSRVKTGVCEHVYKQHMHHCWLIDRPATGHSG